MAYIHPAILEAAADASDLGHQLADQSGRPAVVPRGRPRRLTVNFVLGDGDVITERVELGEVKRITDPVRFLKALEAGHWFGLEVTEP